MADLHIDDASAYYDKHINRTERFDIFRERNFPIPGSVPPIDWEVFGAILTGDEKKKGYGSDLKYYEIKSAGVRAGYEYQYHKNHGIEKLDEDKTVNHIFVEYSSDYQDVTVRQMKAEHLASLFEGWRAGLIENYERGRQRFRKSIAYGTVAANGIVVMEIRQGSLRKTEATADEDTA